MPGAQELSSMSPTAQTLSVLAPGTPNIQTPNPSFRRRSPRLRAAGPGGTEICRKLRSIVPMLRQTDGCVHADIDSYRAYLHRCVHTHIYRYIYTYTYICICAYTHTHTYIYAGTCLLMYLYINTYTQMLCISTNLSSCPSVCLSIYLSIYT